MEQVFLKLVNMSISASWLVLAVVVLRLMLKKAPKWLCCGLWALVAVRLLCPVSLESVLSLIPSGETVPPEIVYAPKPTIDSGVEVINRVVNPVMISSFEPKAVGASVNPIQVWLFIAEVVWVIGMGLMAVYALVSWWLIRRRVSASVRLKENVWLCDYIDSPFILGIVKPRIYLPSGMVDSPGVVHVLAHERAHLARKDHWWKPLGFALLTVYWFNPVMWVAYVLLCRDIELACDERVIKDLGAGEKKRYSEALLECSVSRRMIAACPLAFGEVGVKARVKTVLNYKKPAFWVMVLAIVVCVVVAVCFLTDPVEEPEETLPTEMTEATQPSETTGPAPTQPTGGIEDESAGEGVAVAFGDNVMSLWLPEGWRYELVSEEFGAVFGIAFWPEGVSGGRVKIVLMDQPLGVCGTGLEVEEVNFPNGLVGGMGIYNDLPSWSYIAFGNTPGYYVAMTEGVESWWGEYGDQVMEILGSAELGRGIVRKEEAIAAAQKVTGENGGYWSAWYDVKFAVWRVEQYASMEDSSPRQTVLVDDRGNAVSPDEWGILLTATNASPTGVTLNCIQSGGTAAGELMTGQPYWLERWNGAQWETVPPVTDGLAWTTEGLVIMKNESTSWNLNWEWRYGTLPEGSYRIGKNISHEVPEKVFANGEGISGKDETRTFYADFVVDAAAEDPDAVSAEGSGGEFSWSLENNVLTVTGAGTLTDEFTEEWQKRRYDILTLVLDPRITEIGDNAFDGLHMLSDVRLHEGITRIGSNAFDGCVIGELPESLTIIGAGAFAECKLPQTLVVPESVKYIGAYAFGHAEDLEYLEIKGSPYIDSNAFEYCYALKEVVLSDRIEMLGRDMFFNCGELTSIDLPDAVTEIPDGCFGGCEKLASVKLPEGVTSIGRVAFLGCGRLRQIQLPDGLVEIGENAFEECAGLPEIAIPASVTQIGDLPFKECTALTEITVDPDNPNYASDELGALYDKSMTTLIQAPPGAGVVKVAQGVTQISDWEFKESQVREIILPDGVTSIGFEAFADCGRLETLLIPDSVTDIGTGILKGCTALKNVRLPISVTRIDNDTFEGCTALKEISIHKGIEFIAAGAFDDCTALTDVYFEGTREEWEKIVIHAYNEALTGAEIHFGVPYS